MKKSILIVDWLLIIVFILMIVSNIIVSKFINLPFTKIIQPIFLVLIIIHIIQHWKVVINSFKGSREKIITKFNSEIFL